MTRIHADNQNPIIKPAKLAGFFVFDIPYWFGTCKIII